MTVTLQVDAEQLMYEFLRDDTDVNALVSGRVYSIIPKGGKPTLPFVRYQLGPGDGPVHSYPLALERAQIQIDCWGATKATARTTAATCRAAIAARILGAHATGTVCNIAFGALMYIPDPDYNDPPQPRYIFDVTLTTKP